MKKTHKMSRMLSKIFGWVVRPVCKVDNKTYAYIKSTRWDDVTCERCLIKKDTK